MKRKLQFLTKTLLVAAGLCVGSMSAWAVDYPYSVGTSTDDTWFSHISPVYSLSGNGIIDITFTNHCLTTGDNWQNWLLVCGKSTDTQVLGADNDNRYFIMRADRWDDINGTDEYRDAHIFVSDDYWTDFKTFQNEATVKMRISRVGTLVTVQATITKNSSSRYISYFYSGVGESENLQFYLTQNLSYLTIDSEPVITNTIISQDYTNGVADWTSSNTNRYTVSIETDRADKYVLASTTSGASGTNLNGTDLTGTTLNGKILAGSDFASSSDFTLFFDMRLNGANTGQNPWFLINDASNPSTSNNDASPTSTNRMLLLHQPTAGTYTWQINGSTDQTVTLPLNTWYTFQLSKTGALVYLTITNRNTGAEVFPQQTIAVNSSLGGLGNMRFVTKRYNASMSIDNIVLRDWQDGDTPAGTATTYTIKYRNESDVEIASDVVVDGLAGDEVTASAAQMNPITYNTQKYIYKSGNENITLVADASSNVITLVYREAETYTYKVTSSLGTVLVNSSDKEGETVTVPYPKYELDGTDLKEAAKSEGTAWYANSYTLSANVDETITYNEAATPITNVVFYTEGESITGATRSTSNNANIRNSNGAVGYAAGTAGEDDLTITTLAPGKYRIVANVHTSSSGAGTSTFILGANNFGAEGDKSSYNTEKTSDEFTIYVNTDLKLQAGGGAQNAVDYVYVIKTGDATISATLDNAGYATLASTYPLDVTTANMTASSGTATAYKAAIDGTVAKFTELSQTIPANTGILLKGTANATVTIPVVASGDAVDGNAFLVNEGGATFAGDDDYYYFAMKKNAATLTFGTFAPGTLAFPANKAYLKVLKTNFTTPAPSLTFDFGEGETTGINTVQGSEFTVNGEYYNLAGQRVAQPTKGLYIVNGKKVVIK